MGRAPPTVAPGAAPPWWLVEAPLDPPAPPLEGDAETDVAIVGGGYTGLWTAIEVKEREPARDVLVLEAVCCGHGPSGRNGGFLHGYWASLARLRDALGPRHALAVARASEGAIAAVRALGDDVWLREGGLLRISTSAAQDAAVDRAIAAARELGVEEEAIPLDREELAGRCRSPVFRRGVWFRDGATVQPARLVRALRRRALAVGVRIHEATRVLRVAGHTLETAGGRVRAGDVVVATNAWAAGWQPLSRLITPFGSYVVLTEPVPELLEEVGWTGEEAIMDARLFLHYFRTTPEGRVLMGSASGPIGSGGRIGRRFTHDAATVGRAEAGLRRLLPALAAARVEHAWGGPVDVSFDHFPVFGTVRGQRVHYGAGFTGNGVGPSWLGGKILASLALGSDDEWSRLPLVGRAVRKLPPEPLNSIGGRLVRTALLAVDDAEDAGRRSPAVARFVASLPRRLGIEVASR